MNIHNELQRGNKVLQGTVKSFYEHGIHVGFGKTFKYEELTPVVLTENILKEAGFENTANNTGTTVSLWRKGRMLLHVMTENKKRVIRYYTLQYDFKPIKHLHTLQNLYSIIEQKPLYDEK